MKCSIRFIILQLVILIAVSQPVTKGTDIDDETANRHPRAVTATPSCSVNQYFDKEEGRCLGIAGGGKVIHINGTKSCGTNVLKPYCNDPRYYYICKKSKTILLRCPEGQHFENRLQKCVHGNATISHAVDESNPDLFDSASIGLPACEKPGSFPIAEDCTLFYTCETTGLRLFQNIFKCPKDMVYDAKTGVCSLSAVCRSTKRNKSLYSCAMDATKEVTLLQNENEGLSTYETTLINVLESVTEPMNTDESILFTTNDDNEFLSTTVSYSEQVPREFVELDDNRDVVTSTERLSEPSRTSNSVDQTTTDTYSTNVDEFALPEAENLFTTTEINEPFVETTTSMDLILRERYGTTEMGNDRLGTTEEASDYEENTQSALEAETTDSTTTISSTDSTATISPTDSFISTTEPHVFTQDFSQDAFLDSNDSDDFTETIPTSSEMTTSIYSTSTDEEMLLSNDTGTTETYFDDGHETSTQQTNDQGNFEDAILMEEFLGPMSSENILDFASSTDATNDFSTVSIENVTGDSTDFDEIDQDLVSSTTLSTLSLLETTLSEDYTNSESTTVSTTTSTSELLGITMNENENNAFTTNSYTTEINFSTTDYGTYEEEDEERNMRSTTPNVMDVTNDENFEPGEFTTAVTSTIGNELFQQLNEPFTTTQKSVIVQDEESISSENENLDPSETPLSSNDTNTIPQVTFISLPEHGMKLKSLCNETNSKSSDKQLHSPVTDEQSNTASKQNRNVAESQLKSTPNMIHPENRRTISKHIALPIVSAVLNITDQLERQIQNALNRTAKTNA